MQNNYTISPYIGMPFIYTDIHYARYMEKLMFPVSCKNILKDSVLALRKHTKEFDAIAVRGNSGTLVAGHLMAKLNKTLILSRKEKNSHSRNSIEYISLKDRFIVVDDFIDSGDTMATILNHLLNEGFHPENFAGMYLYNNNWYFNREECKKVFVKSDYKKLRKIHDRIYG